MAGCSAQNHRIDRFWCSKTTEVFRGKPCGWKPLYALILNDLEPERMFFQQANSPFLTEIATKCCVVLYKKQSVGNLRHEVTRSYWFHFLYQSAGRTTRSERFRTRRKLSVSVLSRNIIRDNWTNKTVNLSQNESRTLRSGCLKQRTRSIYPSDHYTEGNDYNSRWVDKWFIE